MCVCVLLSFGTGSGFAGTIFRNSKTQKEKRERGLKVSSLNFSGQEFVGDYKDDMELSEPKGYMLHSIPLGKMLRAMYEDQTEHHYSVFGEVYVKVYLNYFIFTHYPPNILSSIYSTVKWYRNGLLMFVSISIFIFLLYTLRYHT